MSPLDQIANLLPRCSPAERQELFRRLREEFPVHPLERELHAKAEIILEAIHRAGGLTLRMIRGVIAEAAYDVEVVERLTGWQKIPREGDLPYDFLLRDSAGDVRVQVKLQRSKEGRPMRASEAPRYLSFSPQMSLVETQKTRGGKTKKTGKPTRPYRFGEFDVLAVATYPSTHRWDTFLYTVADWLIPAAKGSAEIMKYQPVPPAPNDDWTDDFATAVRWLRSGEKRTIRAR